MLRISDSVAQNAVVMARSTLLPNVLATGGYLVSNPNLFNGYQKEFGGTFTAGVVVNIPIFHPGGAYAVKAAKHKRMEVGYQMEEAKEMIELQVNKVKFELDLAYKKLAQANSNLENADENLKLADESFKAGVCSSSDRVAAQTAWIKAKSEVLDAKSVIEMSKLYLKQAMGE
jgi:outer membrane protein TolC